jgi:crossover junction endodeoxyribonuclease RuvC
MIYVGIDPGATGAISVITDAGLTVYRFKMTEKFTKDVHIVRGFLESLFFLDDKDMIVYLEKVHSMPGQGVTSVFTFGQMVGIIQGMLKQAGLKYKEVTPQDWQRKLAPELASKDKALRKREYQYKAQKLFPNNTITLDAADSVLIAYYAKVMNEEI